MPLPSRRSGLLPTLLASVALVLLLCTSLVVGTVDLTVVDAAKLVVGHLVPGAPWMTDGSYTALQDQAVWEFRMPRAVLASLAGASLALAGAFIQVVVRNPLAEPYLLGVSAGAGLGAASVVALGTAAALSMNTAAFVGALTAMLLVYLSAQSRGTLPATRLILAGVAIGALLSALTSYVTLTTDAQNAFTVLFFLLGSVSAATSTSLVLPAIALAVAIVVSILTAPSMNALLAGDDQARHLGVPVDRLRVVLLAAAALLTAFTVTVAGSIGFVGLVVPHVARLIIGHDHRRMLPFTAVLGASFLCAADLLSRVVAQPQEIPLGIVTAVVGAPFFLWLMRHSDRSTGKD